MITNILVWLVLVVIFILFAWLALRAWRSPRGYIKWPGVVLAGLLSLVFLAVCAVGLRGLVDLYWPKGSTVQLTVNGTPEQVERGKYLANAFCTSCHSQSGDLPLTGGADLAKDVPLPVGSIIPSNLTPAGPLKNWTDGEIFRALRQGVNNQGKMLPSMSTLVNVRYLSDEDLKAVIAYLRSQPAVDHPTQDPPTQFNFLGVLVTGMGIVPPLPEVTGEIVAPLKEATAQYGKYVISFQDCHSCHGSDLNGGTNQLSPNGPTLRMVKGWTQAQFITAMRTGVDPNGHKLNNVMPWKYVGRLDDTDLAALYLYITSRE
ncbi:MAG TPA: c-type cytochrome [Anaerolineales bacterium]